MGVVKSLTASDGIVTAASGGTVDTADCTNNFCTYAKMQDIATDRLLGRDTAASGDPEELTVGGGIEFTGSGGIQRSALTGDVTASAGSNATTIANNAVTYAKMQDVSASPRLIGRTTAGAGDPEEITVNAGLTLASTSLSLTNTNPSNASTADQASIPAATLTYITNSNIAIPSTGLKVKTILRWKLCMSKTAAGTAASTFHVRLGTAGTTADAAILTFTLPVVGTANADQFEVSISVVIRGPLGASCIANGSLSIVKNAGTILGVVNIPTVCVNVTSGTFNSGTANLIAGVSVTSGASVVFSVQQVAADSVNL